jgi:uncharacterized protein
MMTTVLRLIPLTVLTLALVGCGQSNITLHSPDGSRSVTVKVEVADSPKERKKGLMDRTALDNNTGMLFAFTEPQIVKFWMKNTKLPLDIFFFDNTGSFVSYAAMEPCLEDPCTTYSSAALSSFALETNTGFRETHKIGVGWSIDMDELRKITKPM